MDKPVRYIVDTTLRDGEQTPGIAMTLEQKVQIAGILEAAGVHQIEAGTPASGKYEIESIRAIMAARRKAKIAVWNRMHEADLQSSFACEPDIVHISAPVSYPQIYTKLKKNKAWVTKTLLYLAEKTRSKGYEVTVGFEDASRADICFLISLASQLRGCGVSRIRIADTVGVMIPSVTEQIILSMKSYCDLDLEIHAHNDLGMAVANTLTAAKAGVLYLDTTALGLGERAGNCRFEQLARISERIFRLGVTDRTAKQAEDEIALLLKSPLRNSS